MARTVSSTLILPTRDTLARNEIADSSGRGSGWVEVLRAINTLGAQHRGSLVCDADPNGVITSNGQTARYRVPMQALTNSETEVDVYIYGRVTTAGSATLSITSGADSVGIVVNSTSAQWWTASLLLADGSVDDYDTLDCAVSAATATIRIDAICVFYRRADTELPAVASGYTGYFDGFEPHDLVAIDGERPLSARIGRAAHGNLRRLYCRAWPIIAASTVRSPWTADSLGFRAEIPPQIVSRELTATFWAYVAYTGDGTGAQIGRLTVASQGRSHIFSTTSLGFSGWAGPFHIGMNAPAEGLVRPTLKDFLVVANNRLDVYSLCGWWAGMSYGA